MWVQQAVCRPLAFHVGSLAVSVGLNLRLLAWNVSRKPPLFASPPLIVCGPLQLGALIVNPIRPHRVEPRVKKRRPKSFPLMVTPRQELRQQMVQPELRG
jgi:hypothetical protein